MTDTREIIAQQVRCGNVDRVSLEVSDNVISALHAAGFRILGPDEVDHVTVTDAMVEAAWNDWQTGKQEYGPEAIRSALKAAMEAGR